MIGARAADLRKVQPENREVALRLLSFSSSQYFLSKKILKFPFWIPQCVKDGFRQLSEEQKCGVGQ